MKTKDVPMRIPEPMARQIPTERYWDGEDEDDDIVKKLKEGRIGTFAQNAPGY